jgi:hypothetical protein
MVVFLWYNRLTGKLPIILQVCVLLGIGYTITSNGVTHTKPNFPFLFSHTGYNLNTFLYGKTMKATCSLSVKLKL